MFFFVNSRHVFEYLNQQLARMADAQKLNSVHFLTKDFHVWPDLHGNRSPLADPTIKGMICGLTMSSTVDNLALTYLGFVQALSVSKKTVNCEDLTFFYKFFHLSPTKF